MRGESMMEELKAKRMQDDTGCMECGEKLVEGKFCVNDKCKLYSKSRKANRNPVKFRYDLLDKDFLHCMAEIAHYGAETYGEFNWHKSRLEGEKGPVNHIYKHLMQYGKGDTYDHLDGSRKYHLAAIAFNAMMEFYYLERGEE